MKNIIFILMLIIGFGVKANNTNDEYLYGKINLFLQNENNGEQLLYEINKISLEKFNFNSCSNIEVFRPEGSKKIGLTTIGIKCNDINAKKPNVAILKINIPKEDEYFVASKKINANEIISSENVKKVVGDISKINYPYIKEFNKIENKKTKYQLQEGQIISQGMLLMPIVIEYNKNVMVVNKTKTYSASAVGKSMNIARVGESVRVKMPSGKIINGEAQEDGTVSIKGD